MASRNSDASRALGFVEPTECLAVSQLPEGPLWTYKIKLDGYRIQPLKSQGRVTLYSRRGHDLTSRYEVVAKQLHSLPDQTVLDGELVALDEQGRPSFNRLQNYRAGATLMFYAFDVLVQGGRKLMMDPLSARREVLASTLELAQNVGLSLVSHGTAAKMLELVKANGLEGVVAKRSDSVYQPGMRTGLWSKHRVNQCGEFVIGGYVPSHLGVDSIVVGVYREKSLHYAARVRAGFVPATRRLVYHALKRLETARCPFTNLPEKNAERVGSGAYGRKDEGMCLGGIPAVSRSWFPRVDGCRPPAAHTLRPPSKLDSPSIQAEPRVLASPCPGCWN